MVVCVVVTSVCIAVTGVLVVGRRNTFKSTVADLRAEIFDFGFAKDTVEIISDCMLSDVVVNTYIQVLLDGDL